MSIKTLYKYLHPDRVDVLQNLQIRFTQVSGLNDPFESLPGTIQKDREWYLQQFHEKRVDFEMLRLGITGENEREQFKRDCEKEHFNNFLTCYTDQKWLDEQSECVQHGSDHLQGCLSLSTISKNVLMWSHYAHNHKGYVIGFDAEHEYFGRTVRPVVYSDVRPSHNPFEERHSGEIFYTKSKDWTYEQEHRKHQAFVEAIKLADGRTLLPFKSADGPIPINLAIMLFPLPKETIKCLILGWKSAPELEQKLRLALDQHQMNWTVIYRATPSPTKYEMEIKAVTLQS